jgi:hypothetical protein
VQSLGAGRIAERLGTNYRYTLEQRAHAIDNHVLYTGLSEDGILALLIAERNKLNEAIEALSGPTKRIGRPPKNPLTAVTPAAAPTPKKKRRNLSAAQREAAAERMRQRWAAKKKAT